jgi:hypothetical protein
MGLLRGSWPHHWEIRHSSAIRTCQTESSDHVSVQTTIMPPRGKQLFESYLSNSYLHLFGRNRRALLTEMSNSKCCLIPNKSTGKQLLDAILKNKLKCVRFHFNHVANPNVVLSL